MLVFGGGGMLYPSIARGMQQIVESRNGPVILWGVGSNTHGVVSDSYPDWLENCSLVGLRDVNTHYNWVPCSSCLYRSFDEKRRLQPRLRAVAYLHYEISFPREVGEDLPVLKNNATQLEHVLDFLSLGEFVITNTYHGAYWATLLGRKVIAYPFSSKFYGFKHEPVIIPASIKWEDVADMAKTSPESLDECRTANFEFAEKVYQFL